MSNIFVNNKKLILKSLMFMGFVVALVFLFVLIINVNIVAITNNDIYMIDEIDQIPDDYDCILILGCGVNANGKPTPRLYDRIMTGLEAYNSDCSKIIFVTGDSEESDYTETIAMKNTLIENGVYEQNIICDGYGLSTYESIWRAKNIYGYNKILIVSQKYHLNRAIYIAEHLGLEAIGLDAALKTYSKQPYYSFREFFARIKDMIYSEIQPNPQYTEKWEEIYE